MGKGLVTPPLLAVWVSLSRGGWSSWKRAVKHLPAMGAQSQLKPTIEQYRIPSLLQMGIWLRCTFWWDQCHLPWAKLCKTCNEKLTVAPLNWVGFAELCVIQMEGIWLVENLIMTLNLVCLIGWICLHLYTCMYQQYVLQQTWRSPLELRVPPFTRQI